MKCLCYSGHTSNTGEIQGKEASCGGLFERCYRRHVFSCKYFSL